MTVKLSQHLAPSLAPANTPARVPSQQPGNFSPGQTGSAAGPASTKVSLSGMGLLMSRLAGASASAGAENVGGKSVYSHLSAGDRDVLAKLYEQGAAAGEDLQSVDALAFDLGVYRRANDGKSLMDPKGMIFTFDGSQPVDVSFTSEDADVADQILSSDALRTTSLDQGFVQTLLTPGRMSHAVDFRFLLSAITRV